jgi:uncharacterized protein
MIHVTIPTDGQHIHGKLLSPPSGQARCPAMLFVHGWGDTQRRNLGVGKQLCARGFICLTFNLRGRARTRSQRDTVTRMQNLADVIAAYDVLASRPEVDTAYVGVVGSSYGWLSRRPPHRRAQGAMAGAARAGAVHGRRLRPAEA